MKKFKLTNPIERPIPQEQNLLYFSNVLSKYQWVFLLVWTIVLTVLFFFIGKYFGKRQNVLPKENPYFSKWKGTVDDVSNDNVSTKLGDDNPSSRT